MSSIATLPRHHDVCPRMRRQAWSRRNSMCISPVARHARRRTGLISHRERRAPLMSEPTSQWMTHRGRPCTLSVPACDEPLWRGSVSIETAVFECSSMTRLRSPPEVLQLGREIVSVGGSGRMLSTGPHPHLLRARQESARPQRLLPRSARLGPAVPSPERQIVTTTVRTLPRVARAPICPRRQLVALLVSH